MLVADEAVIRLLIGDDPLITGWTVSDLEVSKEFAGVCDASHPLDFSREVRAISPNFGQPVLGRQQLLPRLRRFFECRRPPMPEFGDARPLRSGQAGVACSSQNDAQRTAVEEPCS